MPVGHAEEGLHTPFSAMLTKYVAPINPVTNGDGVEIKARAQKLIMRVLNRRKQNLLLI